MRSLAVRVPGTSATVAIAALAAFLVMAVIAASPGAVAFDAPLIAWVTGLGVPADAWRALTLGGDTMTLFPIGSVLVLWLLWRRRHRQQHDGLRPPAQRPVACRRGRLHDPRARGAVARRPARALPE